MQAISAVSARIEGCDDGLVGRVGLHELGAFADRVGLPQALSTAVPWTVNALRSMTGARC